MVRSTVFPPVDAPMLIGRLWRAGRSQLGRSMGLWMVVAVLVSATVSSGVGVAAARDDSSDERALLDTARAATVYLSVDRVFQGYHSPLHGIGFAAGEDGVVVTCRRTVTSEGTAQIMGLTRTVEMRIVSVEVAETVGPGSPPAVGRILTSSADTGLALVEVESPRQVSISSVDSSGRLVGGETVWCVDVVPGAEDSRSSSRLLRATIGRSGGYLVLRGVDHSAESLCGAPLLNRYGVLVGMVSDSTVGGESKVIPWHEIRQFLDQERVRVQFRPPAVLSPPQPIDVTVTEVFGDLGAVAGSVSFSGAGIEPIEAAMVVSESGWTTTLRLVQRGPTGGVYSAHIELVDAQGETVWTYDQQIEALNEAVIKLDDQRSAETILRRRRELENPVTLSEYADSLRSATPTTAGSTSTDMEDRLNGWIEAATGALEPYRYQELQGSMNRAVAQRFDAVRRLLAMADGSEAGPREFVLELQSHGPELQRLHEAFRRQVASRDLCLCDGSQWMLCASATRCSTMEKFGTSP